MAYFYSLPTRSSCTNGPFNYSSTYSQNAVLIYFPGSSIGSLKVFINTAVFGVHNIIFVKSETNNWKKIEINGDSLSY